MFSVLGSSFLKILSSAWGGIFSIVLYCLWSYLNVWEVNYTHNEYIDYFRLFCAFAITLLFAGLVFLLLYFLTFFRSLHAALFATATFMVIFLNYFFFSSFISNIWLYFFLLLSLTAVTYFLSKKPVFKRIFLLLPLIGSIAIGMNEVARFIRSAPTPHFFITLSEDTPSTELNPIIKPKHTPNVYFIIVDALLRNDGFKRFYDAHDKSYDDFLSYAEKEGFYVISNSYSNYPVTAFSLASTLNMDFILPDKTHGPEEIKNRKYKYTAQELLAAPRGYNAVTSHFRARGYKIYHTNNGFLPASSCRGYEDHCVKKDNLIFFTQQELGLIEMTPLKFIMDKIQVNYKATHPDDKFPDFRDDTIGYFHSFQARDIPKYIPVHEDKPFFWFIHLMGVHNLAFGKNCEYQHPLSILGRTPPPRCPGNLYRTCNIKIAYQEQAICMFSQLKFAIDEIIKRDPEAIIIIQGDHGSSIINNFRERPSEQWTEKDVHEIFSNLNIIRCPEKCRQMLYSDMTSVNTFRIIFSYIDGKKYKLLPDVSYIAAYRNWWPSYKSGDARADFIDPALKKHNFDK